MDLLKTPMTRVSGKQLANLSECADFARFPAPPVRPATITASLNGGLAANGADAPAGPNDATARPSVFSPVVVCLSDFLAIRRSASLKITGKPHSSRSKKQPSAPSSTAFRHSVCIGSGSPPCRRHRGRDGRGFENLKGNRHGKYRHIHQDRQGLRRRDRHDERSEEHTSEL